MEGYGYDEALNAALGDQRRPDLYGCCDGDLNYEKPAEALNHESTDGVIDKNEKGPETERSEKGEEKEGEDKQGKSKLYHWNNDFQDFLVNAKDEDLFEEQHVYQQLSRLGQDFLYSAKMYGRIIISERYLPLERKTIKPSLMGGKAGGEKYLVHDILFKFAVDSEGIYGGDDHLASKVAGHELKSLVQAFNCNISGLCFPLLCLVDYLGFRLLAISLLPIGRDTLVYGSADAGRTVKKSDKTINRAMKVLAKTLNIKRHIVGLPFADPAMRKPLYTPIDFECHRGTDGRYYLLDFSRLMPPEAPGPNFKTGMHLARLLRPELVKQFPKPLSSDAFSRFGHDSSQEHNAEVRSATEHLMAVVVPEYALYLDSQPANIDIEDRGKYLEEGMHLRGINCRHFGSVRRKLKNLLWKKILLVEIIARTLKNIIKERMRERMKTLGDPIEQPYRDVVLDYLNLIFGRSRTSKEYWKKGEMRSRILTYFPAALSEQEDSSKTDLRKSVNMCELFTRMRQVTGIKFSPHCRLDSDESVLHRRNPLFMQDIIELPEKVKAINIIAYSVGADLYCATLYQEGPERHRLCTMAIDYLKPVLCSTPNDARALCLMAQHLNMIRDRGGADEYFGRAVAAGPGNARIWGHYAWFLHTAVTRLDDAEYCYKKALSLKPNHARSLGDYAYFLQIHRKDIKGAKGYFKRCVEVAPEYKQGWADYSKFLKTIGKKKKAAKIDAHIKNMPGMVIVFGNVAGAPGNKK